MAEIKDHAKLAWNWLEEIAYCSETDNPNKQGVTRVCASSEHKEAYKKLTQWMTESGMEVRIDNAANLIGRYTSTQPHAKTIILGSHQDTVPNGGKYDGILGVILPIALINYFNANKYSFPFNIDVVAFSDEEGSRFQSTLLGSKALSGTFELSMLDAIDEDNISMREALTSFGCQPDNIIKDAYHKEDVIGFVEVHIEQGPQLEALNLPVGIVTAITGIERHVLSITGKAGHAGTVPMHMRQNSLVGAAKVIDMYDELCKSRDDLVGVIGKIHNSPNGVNVIPQNTEITIELRSPNDDSRMQAREELVNNISRIMDEYNLSHQLSLLYEQSAIKCSSSLSNVLEHAIEKANINPHYLFSGAGHDGLAMCELTDIAMLFVRCHEGISHHPDEKISLNDVETSLQVLEHFCSALTNELQGE